MRWFKAYKILRYAQQLSLRPVKPRSELKSKLGFNLANASDENFYRQEFNGRSIIYRFHNSSLELYVMENNINEYYSLGNEWENDINGKPMSLADYKRNIAHDYSKQRRSLDENHLIGSPALMTLKQSPYWKELINWGLENYCDFLCINTHGPSFIANCKHQSGLGNAWEWVKIIHSLLWLKDHTKKQIFVTEMGNGQTDRALTKFDVAFLYWVHRLTLDKRMIAATYYDSAIMMKNNGYDFLK